MMTIEAASAATPKKCSYAPALLRKAALWRAVAPLRWTISRALWLVGFQFRLLSWVFWGLQVAIDYARLMYLDYTARRDDVFVVTYPRSGTTWLQMIMYQLTTDGSMDFDHIADVCPWFERAALNKRNFEKLKSPRVFKSHLPYIWIPKRACRFIYCARDGRDVAVSFYHFYRSHFRYRGSFADFFRYYMRGWVVWGSWWYHVKHWWKHRDNPNVLFLFYEDLVNDLEGTIRRIIAFCDLDIPESEMPRILERSSFAFMKQYEMKFDFATEFMLEQGMTPGTFIRRGKAGAWPEYFDERQRAQYDAKTQRALARVGLNRYLPSDEPLTPAAHGASAAEGRGPVGGDAED